MYKSRTSQELEEGANISRPQPHQALTNIFRRCAACLEEEGHHFKNAQ